MKSLGRKIMDSDKSEKRDESRPSYNGRKIIPGVDLTPDTKTAKPKSYRMGG